MTAEAWKYQLQRWLPTGLLWFSAVTFLVAWANYGPPWTLRAASMANLEFFGLFGGGMVCFILVFPVETWKGQIGRVVVALLCLWVFLSGAYSDFGFSGVLDMLLIMFLTYSGALLARRGPRRDQATVELLLRLFVAYITIIVAANVSGVPKAVNDWGTVREALIFSAIYFGVLGGVEATGIYASMRRHWPDEPPVRLTRLEMDDRERAKRDQRSR